MCSKKVRKQLYLIQEQNKELKALAIMRRNTSEASIVREAVAAYLLEGKNRSTKRKPLSRLVGFGTAKHTDNAQHHDDYLYEEEGK